MAIDKAQRALDLARKLRKQIRYMEKVVFEHAANISSLYNRTESLAEELEDLQETCDEGGGNGDDLPFYPYGPRSVDELRQFIIWKWSREALTEVHEKSMRFICALIRDSLVAIYPGIEAVWDQRERHNYFASRTQHLDAFVVVGATPGDDYIVDFMYGSSEGGIIGEGGDDGGKLRWGLGGKNGDGKPDNVDWSIAWGS